MTLQSQLTDYNKKYPWQTTTYKGKEFPYRYHKSGDVTLVLLAGGIGKSDFLFHFFETFAVQGYSVITFDYAYAFLSNAELADAVNHLYLSNTGSLFPEMEPDGMDCMMAMKAKFEKTIKILRFVPIGMIKPSMRKSLRKHVIDAPAEYQPYLTECFDMMLSMLTTKHERHMCRLMLDLFQEPTIRKEDFSKFRGKVLLLLSEDDSTFNDSVKAALIASMPDPEIRTDIKGGHLALLMHIDTYMEVIDNFLNYVFHSK